MKLNQIRRRIELCMREKQAKQGQLHVLTKKLMLQNYNESRLELWFCKLNGCRYNDLVITGPYVEWFVSYLLLDCRFYTSFNDGLSRIPNFDKGLKVVVTGQQRLLTPPWHLIGSLLLSGVHAVVHSHLHMFLCGLSEACSAEASARDCSHALASFKTIANTAVQKRAHTNNRECSLCWTGLTFNTLLTSPISRLTY
jgi:hypothetical protein